MRVHAVFEGGGVRGIALAGAVRAAEMFGVSFDRVAGTSSGSIVAALIAAGYSAEGMKAIIEATPFASFLHRAPLFNVRVVGPAVRLFLFNGLYSGDVLERWVRELLAAKGVRTFGDLPRGKLRIIASDITNERLLVLPDDIEKYGTDPEKFPVARAIRMSACIPYFFDPVPLRIKGEADVPGKTAWIVDGALLSNFPLWLFDKEMENERERTPVIGFRMVGRAEAKTHDIRGPVTMLQALVETMLHAHDERYIERHNQMRTIQIPTLGVGTTEFNLSPEKSLELYVSGLKAGIAFFRKWPETAGQVAQIQDMAVQVAQIQEAGERGGDESRMMAEDRAAKIAAGNGDSVAPDSRPAPSIRFASRRDSRPQ